MSSLLHKIFFGLFIIQNLLFANDDSFIDLKFVIDERALVAELAYCTYAHKYPLIEEFQNEIRSQCPDAYLELAPLVTPSYRTLLAASSLQLMTGYYRDAFSQLLQCAQKIPAYQTLRSQTEQRKKDCEEQWNQNAQVSLRFMKELTGIPFHRSFVVYISHPLVGGGYNAYGSIFWGQKELKKNYTTVYLWHEILHFYLTERNHLSHALIELATDVALRRELNPVDEPDWSGHLNVAELKQLIRKDWDHYVAQSKRDIFALYDDLASKYPVDWYPDSQATFHPQPRWGVASKNSSVFNEQ